MRSVRWWVHSLYLTVVLCAVLSGLTITAQAQVSGANSVQTTLRGYDIPGLDESINLTAFEAWDVVQLIQFLAHRGGINNVVIGQGVQGMTTRLKFENVTVGDALEVVLTVNQLAYTVRGGIITIMTDAEYRTLFGRSFYDYKEVRVVRLDYADPAHVMNILEPIKSTIGTIVADSSAGTLVLIDTPAKLAEMEAIIREADLPTLARVIPTETMEFRLQYADVDIMRNEVAGLLSDQAGFMHADARTRTLRVTDVPHIIRRVEDLVTLYDQRPRQVFIEAKVVQVQLNDASSFGVNWSHVVDGLNPRFRLSASVRPGLTPQPPSTQMRNLGIQAAETLAGGGGGLSYQTITAGGQLGAVLQALQSVGETRLLSNPHIAVVDGEQAEIRVVTERPYSEAQLESGSTNVVGETYKFIEVGVTLAVTPRISDDNMISMHIRPEISSVLETYRGVIGRGDGVPVVRRSYAETSVSIRDGETIIIAGMIESEKEESESRVPFLGRIPILGVLFRRESESLRNNELIVFLTPRIISGERPFLRMEDIKKRPRPMRSVGAVDDEVKALRPLR